MPLEPAPPAVPVAGATPGNPPRQMVLLGASNVARGLSTALGSAALLWPGPLDVLAALGHGRSFGMYTTFLGRGLPGIVKCGLWHALERRPHAPLSALITDIGNDLVYEAPVEQIVEWLETCLNRLAPRGAEVTMTALPLFSLDKLNRATYRFFRTMFFPTSRISLPTVAERARRLDEHVRRLAVRHGAKLIEPRREWYAFDPIHVRFGRRGEAWRAMLGAWHADAANLPLARPSFRRWVYLCTRSPEAWRRFGWPRNHSQPCGRLPGPLAVSLY